MGKMKIRLFPDGTIQMETEGIKGKRCTDYAKVLASLLMQKYIVWKKLKNIINKKYYRLTKRSI